MTTCIEIRLAERTKGENLALTAYVYHGDRLVCSDEIMFDRAILVVTLGAAFEHEVRWAINAIRRGDHKLAEDRLKKCLTGSA